VSRKPGIRWSRLADLDLQSAHSYLLGRSPQAARRWAAEILDAVESLRTHPALGVVARDLSPIGRYRHLIVTNHRIIYRLDDEVIWILRIWDTRQNPAALVAE
jgi:plasmid stabilization system protein ParE